MEAVYVPKQEVALLGIRSAWLKAAILGSKLCKDLQFCKSIVANMHVSCGSQLAVYLYYSYYS